MRTLTRIVRGLTTMLVMAAAGVVMVHTPAMAIPNTSWGSGSYTPFFEFEHENFGGGAGAIRKGTNGCTSSTSSWEVSIYNVGSTWNDQISSYGWWSYGAGYVPCRATHYKHAGYVTILENLRIENANMGTADNDQTTSIRLT